MNILRKITKISLVILGIALVSFFIYANLDTKPMHAYAKPTGIELFEVKEGLNDQRIEELNTKIEAIEGITAFAGNAESKIISVLYNPEKINQKKITEILIDENLTLEKPSFGPKDPNVAECPVPYGYILQFQKLKYAFNIR